MLHTGLSEILITNSLQCKELTIAILLQERHSAAVGFGGFLQGFSVWFPSRYSGFLPQAKVIQVWWLSVYFRCESLRLFVSMCHTDLKTSLRCSLAFAHWQQAQTQNPHKQRMTMDAWILLQHNIWTSNVFIIFHLSLFVFSLSSTTNSLTKLKNTVTVQPAVIPLFEQPLHSAPKWELTQVYLKIRL